jgi:hypothetical protein
MGREFPRSLGEGDVSRRRLVMRAPSVELSLLSLSSLSPLSLFSSLSRWWHTAQTLPRATHPRDCRPLLVPVSLSPSCSLSPSSPPHPARSLHARTRDGRHGRHGLRYMTCTVPARAHVPPSLPLSFSRSPPSRAPPARHLARATMSPARQCSPAAYGRTEARACTCCFGSDTHAQRRARTTALAA